MAINSEEIKQTFRKQMELVQQHRIEDQLQQRMIDRSSAKQKHRAHQDELWKSLAVKSDEMYKSSLKGYETWITIMGEILSFCLLVNETLSGETAAFYEQIGHNALDYALDKLQYRTVKLPDLQHCVTFTDTDKLDVSSISQLLRSDHLEFTAEQKKILDKSMQIGIISWLDTLGYVQKQNEPTAFVSKTNATLTLTKARFEELRDDPQDGLDVFLSGQFGMNVTKSPTMC